MTAALWLGLCGGFSHARADAPAKRQSAKKEAKRKEAERKEAAAKRPPKPSPKSKGRSRAKDAPLDPRVVSAARIIMNAKKHGESAVVFIRQSKSGKTSIVIAIGEEAEKLQVAIPAAGDGAAKPVDITPQTDRALEPAPEPSAAAPLPVTKFDNPLAAPKPRASAQKGLPVALESRATDKASESDEDGVEPPAAPSGPHERMAKVKTTGQHWFEIAAGAGILSRSFGYSESGANSTNLRDYSIAAMPLLEASASFYPAAGSSSPLLRGLGVVGALGFALTTESVNDGSSRFNTSSRRWHAGLDYAFTFGKAAQLNSGVSYGRQRFVFEETNAQAYQIVKEAPDVNYRFIRPHLGARYTFGPAALSMSVGYLGVLAGGKTYDRFREVQLDGIDAKASLDVNLPLGLSLVAAADYRRIFSSFEPQVGDDFVAGGALEQFITSTLSLRYALGAQASSDTKVSTPQSR